MGKMAQAPNRQRRRNLKVTNACLFCGISYHPYVGREQTQRYCSRACMGKVGLAKINGTAQRVERPPRECPRCRQSFTPKRTAQQFCSSNCAQGYSMAHIDPAVVYGEVANEKRREALRRRVAEGRPLRPKHAQQPKQPRQDKLGAPALPTLPAMPPDPIALDTSDTSGSLSIQGQPAPLAFPLQGADARDEWQAIGEMREAQADRRLQVEELTRAGRTLILAGQGSYLGVEGTALVAHQGRTHGVPAPARELLYPAMHGVRRILWVGAHGFISGTLTLAAATWCQREGISLVVLDGAGDPLLVTLPDYPHDAELRRRQWLVSSGVRPAGAPSAGQIVREVLRRKIEGQYQTLAVHPDLPGQADALPSLEAWCNWLTLSQPPAWQYDVDHMRRAEARLAAVYFHAWEGWPLRWAKPDVRRLPPHWLTARSRVSPLSSQGSGRHAVDPLNACLNYAYACLASQCRQALLAEGFDLACGFLHADKPGRDSLTYDLMELERGAVDGLVLDFLGKTTLHYADFARAQDGSLTIHPQLTTLLLASCRVPQSCVDSHAKWLRRFLLNGPVREDGPAESPDE